MAHIHDKLVPGTIISLINPGETLIGRVESVNAEEDLITINKPHIMIAMPGPQGMRIQMAPYSEGNFVVIRESRQFQLSSFITIDKTNNEMADVYKNVTSAIKTPPKSPLII